MKTILVIEDDYLTREVIAMDLATSYHVMVADDGDSGLKLAQNHLPDLIISDIAMQNLDGISLLQNLRESVTTQSIPLLFISGYREPSMIRRAMSLGADDYLLKPFDFADLHAAIKASLLKQSQRNAKYENILRQLCNNISTSLPHELRTSVMVVQGYTHILMEEKDRFEPEVSDMLDNIQRYADRLSILAEKMYWHSITEIHQKEPRQNPETIESHKITQKVAEEIANKQGRYPDLLLNLQAIKFKCSEDFFQRIVLEIIENAFKFSYPQDPVQVSSCIENACFVLRIKDNGRGFQPHELEQINPFMQFGRDKYEQQGTGLGLSIAKRLVEILQGQLTIQSKLNRCTVVTISLPISQ